jgi:hypothetical protein
MAAKTASTDRSSSALMLPICSRILDRATAVTFSTMISEGERSPFAGVASSRTLVGPAPASSLVSGHTKSVGRSAKASDCTTRAGRGLPKSPARTALTNPPRLKGDRSTPQRRPDRAPLGSLVPQRTHSSLLSDVEALPGTPPNARRAPTCELRASPAPSSARDSGGTCPSFGHLQQS